MLDILGAILLGALSVAWIWAVAQVFWRRWPQGWSATVLLAGWFLAVTLLAARGVFAEERFGALAIGLAVLMPIAIFAVSIRLSSALRSNLRAMPLGLLVGMHAGRLLGIFFLLLLAAGRVPPTFALTAGWGDILVALAALPIAWLAHRQGTGWSGTVLAWNTVGALDLLTAITLGVGSAPNSPLRFLVEGPASSPLGSLPWVLIPGFLVPLYFLSHLAIYYKLAAGAVHKEHVPMASRPAAAQGT